MRDGWLRQICDNRCVNTTLDHLGFVGPRLEPMRSAFMALGFMPTEPKLLMGRDPDSGKAVPLDQWSCHVVFERGYLELSAVVGRPPGHHLSAYGTATAGLQICAFGTNDLQGTHARCRESGMQVGAAQWAAREIQYGKRHGDARFHWFMVDPANAPDGLLCYVEHATPELVYQPEVQQHANGARALTMLGIVLPTVDAVAAARSRYACLLGTPGDSANHAQVVFRLGHARLVLNTLDAALESFGSAASEATSAMAIVGVEVVDMSAAAACLATNAVPFVERAGRLIVPPRAACGAALCLHAPGRVF